MSDLKDRTREFSLRIIRLVSALPDSRIAWRLGDQLLRALVSLERTEPLMQETRELTAICVTLIRNGEPNEGGDSSAFCLLPLKKWRSK